MVMSLPRFPGSEALMPQPDPGFFAGEGQPSTEQPPATMSAAGSAVAPPAAASPSSPVASNPVRYYPPEVEQWRSAVSKYFSPDQVDKALYVIQHESGGNPGAQNTKDGLATGLFQIQNLAGRPAPDALKDPEANIRYAAQDLGAAKGNWGPWGEGTTYQGKPFGSLGASPYEGVTSGATAAEVNPNAASTQAPNRTSGADLRGGVSRVASQVRGGLNAVNNFGRVPGVTPFIENELRPAISSAIAASPVGLAATAGSDITRSLVGRAFSPSGKQAGDFAASNVPSTIGQAALLAAPFAGEAGPAVRAGIDEAAARAGSSSLLDRLLPASALRAERRGAGLAEAMGGERLQGARTGQAFGAEAMGEGASGVPLEPNSDLGGAPGAASGEASPPTMRPYTSTSIAEALDRYKAAAPTERLFIRFDPLEYKPGDKLPPSRQWVNDAPSSRTYVGTSVIDPTYSRFAPGDLTTKYEGTPYLVRGQVIRRGADPGEVFLRNPEVVRPLDAPVAATEPPAAPPGIHPGDTIRLADGKTDRVVRPSTDTVPDTGERIPGFITERNGWQPASGVQRIEGTTAPPAEPPTGTGGGEPPSPGMDQPSGPTPRSEAAATLRSLYGVDVPEPGLSRADRAMNAIKRVTGIGVQEESIATTIMRVRQRAADAIASQANRTGAQVGAAIKKAFALDKEGRYLGLPNEPTIADIAANLPSYWEHLTPEQQAAMTALREHLAPFSEVLKSQAIETGSRPDVVEGGFYVPRGKADVEGADAPLTKPGGRSGAGGKKGFERQAVFDTQAQGIEAGYQYAPIGDAVQSYARDAGHRALDRYVADYLATATDNEGKVLASSAADRLNPQLRSRVEGLRAKISGSLQTLTNQTTRGTTMEQNRQLVERLLAKAESDVQKTLDKVDVRAARFGHTDVSVLRAEAELGAYDKAAQRIGGTVQTTAARQLAGEIRQTATTSATSDLRAELDGLKNEWERAKTRAAQTPRGMGSIQMSGLEGLSFPDAVANAANKHLLPSDPAPIVSAVNNLLRGFRATGDASGVGIQALLGAANDLPTYLKANAVALRSIGDREAFGNFLNDFDMYATEHGLPTSKEWAAHGVHIGGPESEFMLGTKNLGNLGETLSRAPVLKQANRHFGTLGDTLRLLAAQDKLEATGGVYSGAASSLKDIAHGANLMTGYSSGRLGGDVGSFVTFAPRFIQSQFEMLGRAIGDGSLTGDMARRSLLKLMGKGTMLTIAANNALGNDQKGFDYMTPFDKQGGLNPNFMRIRYKGTDYSVFGPWDSLLRGTAAASQGDFGYIARSKASPVIGLAWDHISGKTFTGQPANTPEGFIRGILPFSVSNAGNESALATGIGAAGFKATPETPNEKRDAAAFQQFGRHFGDLTQTEKDQVNAIPEVAKVQAGKPQSVMQGQFADVTQKYAGQEQEALSHFKAGTLDKTMPEKWTEIGIAKRAEEERLQNVYGSTISGFPKDRQDKVTAPYYDIQIKDPVTNAIDWDATYAKRLDYVSSLSTNKQGGLPSDREIMDSWLMHVEGAKTEDHQKYDAYIQTRKSLGYLDPNADHVALDAAHPEQDVANWFWKGGVVTPPGGKDTTPSLNSAAAVDQALALNLPNRPVKYAGLGRDVNESPQTQAAWKISGDRLDRFLGDALVKQDTPRATAYLSQRPGWAALSPERKHSEIASLIRTAAREATPDLDAWLGWWGVESTMRTIAAGNFLSQIRAQYGHEPVDPRMGPVRYAVDAR